MTVEDTLSQDGFVETVGTALERLRQYAPEIEWIVEEDGSITVYLERDGDHCNFCDEEVEFIGGDWYSVSDKTTDCLKSGGHVVV